MFSPDMLFGVFRLANGEFPVFLYKLGGFPQVH